MTGQAEQSGTSGRPSQISVNFAVSADGKISSVARRPSGWTSSQDHERLKALRIGAGALLVGRGTLEADRMTMTAPGNPWRCIISHHGGFDFAHPVFHTPGGPIHLVVTGNERLPTAPEGVTVHYCSLPGFLTELEKAGIDRLHCEGGGSLVQELAALDAIDQIHLTWAGHTLFGGQGAPTITGVPGDFRSDSRAFELEEFEPVAETGECFLSYRRKH